MSRQAYEYHPVRCTDVHSFRLTITHDCADPDACEWSAVGKGALAERVEHMARIADALTSRLVEVEAERDALAAKLAKAEHHRELAREARDNWERLYRAACWLPDSDHVARRIEDIATKAVEAIIERDAARARVRELEGGS